MMKFVAMYGAMAVRDPANPTGFVGIADILTRQGRLDEAEAMLRRAESLDPRLTGGFVGRALVAVMETYQDEGGAIAIPQALHPYLRGLTRIEPLETARRR